MIVVPSGARTRPNAVPSYKGKCIADPFSISARLIIVVNWGITAALQTRPAMCQTRSLKRTRTFVDHRWYNSRRGGYTLQTRLCSRRRDDNVRRSSMRIYNCIHVAC